MITKENPIAKRLDRIIFPQGGSYFWGALAGPQNAGKRQAVMTELGHKLPKSKCGYTIVFESLCKLVSAAPDESTSHREGKILSFLKENT